MKGPRCNLVLYLLSFAVKLVLGIYIFFTIFFPYPTFNLGEALNFRGWHVPPHALRPHWPMEEAYGCSFLLTVGKCVGQISIFRYFRDEV